MRKYITQMGETLLMWLSIGGAVVGAAFLIGTAIVQRIKSQQDDNEKLKNNLTIVSLQNKNLGEVARLKAQIAEKASENEAAFKKLAEANAKLADVQEHVRKTADEQLKYTTGGDSWAYIAFWPNWHSANDGSKNITKTFERKLFQVGKYPLKNVHVTIVEPIKYFIQSPNSYDAERYEIPELHSNPTGFTNNTTYSLPERIIDEKEKVLLINCTIRATNDEFVQRTKLYGRNKGNSDYIEWFGATEVFSAKTGKLRMKKVDPGFPLTPNGRIDFTVATTREEYEKGAK